MSQAHAADEFGNLTFGFTTKESLMGSVRKYEGKRGASWYYVIDVPSDRPGVRNQRTRRGFPTKKAAREAMEAEMVERRQGLYIEPSMLPTGYYLDKWLTETAHTRATSTHHNYTDQINRLRPHIGDIPLGRLTALSIQSAYREMQETFAASTVRSAHTVLHAALEQAVRWNMLARNPGDHISLPTAVSRVPIWTEGEARQFLSATAESRDHALWRLYLDSGMRVGEGLALQWGDVDLERMTVRIRRTTSRGAAEERIIVERTKTGGGRVIAIAQATAAKLRAYAALQKRRQLAAGEWEPSGLVFDRGDGHLVDATVVRTHFINDCQHAEVPVIQLKALRHTAATMMVANGIPLHTVSKRLGHSTIRLTADLYAHASPDADRSASVLMERVFAESVSNS